MPLDPKLHIRKSRLFSSYSQHFLAGLTNDDFTTLSGIHDPPSDHPRFLDLEIRSLPPATLDAIHAPVVKTGADLHLHSASDASASTNGNDSDSLFENPSHIAVSNSQACSKHEITEDSTLFSVIADASNDTNTNYINSTPDSTNCDSDSNPNSTTSSSSLGSNSNLVNSNTANSPSANLHVNHAAPVVETSTDPHIPLGSDASALWIHNDAFFHPVSNVVADDVNYTMPVNETNTYSHVSSSPDVSAPVNPDAFFDPVSNVVTAHFDVNASSPGSTAVVTADSDASTSSDRSAAVENNTDFEPVFSDVLQNLNSQSYSSYEATNSPKQTVSNSLQVALHGLNAAAFNSYLPTVPSPAAYMPFQINLPQPVPSGSTESITLIRTPSLGILAIPSCFLQYLTQWTRQHAPAFDWIQNTKRIRLQPVDPPYGNPVEGDVSGSVVNSNGSRGAGNVFNLSQTHVPNNPLFNATTNATPHHQISASSASKRKRASSQLGEGSSKRARTESVPPTFEDNGLDHVPGLYHQTDRTAWQCCFQMNEDEVCNLVMTDRRSLNRHIGVHARKEQKAIQEGKLLPHHAVAIPKTVVVNYVCEIPDCGYLSEHKVPFSVSGHRVDNQKAKHLRIYHYDMLSK